MDSLNKAGDPNTDPALLLELARHVDPGVRAEVAMNPNAPESAIRTLASDLDRDVRTVVAQYGAPPDVLAQLALDPDAFVRVAAAANSDCPSEALATLANDHSEIEYDDGGGFSIREAVSSNPSTPCAVLEVLAQDELCEVLIAGNPSTPVATLEILSESPNVETRANVARNRNTAVHVLRILADDPSESVRASTKHFSGSYATHHASADDDSDRAKLARAESNELTEQQRHALLLELVTKSHDTDVRSEIAQLRDCPEDVMLALASDSVTDVRLALSENPWLPERVMLTLCDDDNEDIRVSLTMHDSITPQVRERLLRDSSDWVREMAAE